MLIQPEPTTRGAENIRQEIIRQARKYVETCGVTPADSEKLQRVFQGPAAPCPLKTAKLHLGYVNQACEKLGILLDRLSGGLTVEPGAGQPPYEVALRSEGEQHLFLLAVERMGTVTGGTPTIFWSYHLLCCETEGEGAALVLALDLANDGENLSLQTSRRIYLQRKRNPITGVTTTTDRLARLEGRANLEGVLTHVMVAEGFPYSEARVNRATPAQLAERRRGVAPPVSLLPGAGGGVPTGNGYASLLGPGRGTSRLTSGGGSALVADYADPFAPQKPVSPDPGD
ncbi:MAG: hypothetical protein ACK47B_27880 [Armatimonadota bacterium]